VGFIQLNNSIDSLSDLDYVEKKTMK